MHNTIETPYSSPVNLCVLGTVKGFYINVIFPFGFSFLGSSRYWKCLWRYSAMICDDMFMRVLKLHTCAAQTFTTMSWTYYFHVVHKGYFGSIRFENLNQMLWTKTRLIFVHSAFVWPLLSRTPLPCLYPTTNQRFPSKERSHFTVTADISACCVWAGERVS